MSCAWNQVSQAAQANFDRKHNWKSLGNDYGLDCMYFNCLVEFVPRRLVLPLVGGPSQAIEESLSQATCRSLCGGVYLKKG